MVGLDQAVPGLDARRLGRLDRFGLWQGATEVAGGVDRSLIPQDHLTEPEVGVAQALRNPEVAGRIGVEGLRQPERLLELLSGVVGPANLAEDLAQLLVGDGPVEVGTSGFEAPRDLVESFDRRGEHVLPDRPSRGGLTELLLDVGDQPAIGFDHQLSTVDGRALGHLCPP